MIEYKGKESRSLSPRKELEKDFEIKFQIQLNSQTEEKDKLNSENIFLKEKILLLESQQN